MESTDTPDNYTFDYDLSSAVCEHKSFGFVTMSTTIFYPLVFLLSLMGNSLVLWVLVKYESLESLTNVFILNLCLSDLVFSILLPLWVLEYHMSWFLGDFMCKLSNMLFSVSLFSSIFFLTIMTVHRYLSVVNPLSSLSFNTFKCRMLVTTIVWVASILSSIPDAMFHKVNDSSCDYSGTMWHAFSVYQHNTFFLLSLGTIVFCYVRILSTLLRMRSRRHHRTVILILTIVVAYFLSWAPYNLVMFLETLLKLGIIGNCGFKQQVDYALLICRHLAFSHCCLNPVLYVFVGIKFRRHLKRLFQFCWLCQHQATSSLPKAHSLGGFNYEGASFY
ncbi:chemokine XC receptor 1 [Sorex araneus]|uniref:chemokine XC receptor 1 n=1 Tax=Sorex araneus TaxID=42254 RepID=UPI000158152D|nr:chemokine XC receptor 1 [Sorex araneus]